MSLGQKILRAIEGPDLGLPVRRVQLGLAYSAVQLQDGSTGVAFSFPRKGCGLEIGDDRPLSGRPAGELVSYLGSRNPAASTLALATINALISSRGLIRKDSEADILERLDIRDGDQVCMVGCFLPILRKLENRSVRVVAVDQEEKPAALPEEQSTRLLPQSQVAIITATAIINNTIDQLLDLAINCREVAILGPSTPLLPEAFRGSQVRCLSGIRVEQPDRVFGVISEGRGFKVFKRYVTKVSLRI